MNEEWNDAKEFYESLREEDDKDLHEIGTQMLAFVQRLRDRGIPENTIPFVSHYEFGLRIPGSGHNPAVEWVGDRRVFSVYIRCFDPLTSTDRVWCSLDEAVTTFVRYAARLLGGP